MNGLLIFDNDPKTTLVDKVTSALKQYEVKRASRPELKKAEVCLISPLDADGVNFDEISKACGVTVKAFGSVTCCHLWVGYEDVAEKVKA